MQVSSAERTYLFHFPPSSRSQHILDVLCIVRNYRQRPWLLDKKLNFGYNKLLNCTTAVLTGIHHWNCHEPHYVRLGPQTLTYLSKNSRFKNAATPCKIQYIWMPLLWPDPTIVSCFQVCVNSFGLCFCVWLWKFRFFEVAELLSGTGRVRPSWASQPAAGSQVQTMWSK